MANPLISDSHEVKRGDFASAGGISARYKRMAKQLGLDARLVRMVSVASYESELNLVIHSLGGTLSIDVYPDRIVITSKDAGPGIPDITLAMQEGWSTATESVRAMGFGAGMGLPNMKRHSHKFDIQSAAGQGTTITMEIHIPPAG